MPGVILAWREWRERSEIMRDMRRRAADRKELDAFKVRDLLLEASAAADGGSLGKATAIWQEALALDRDAAGAAMHVEKLLITLKRLDEAEDLLSEGQRKNPGDPHYWGGLAAIAEAKGNNQEALEYYAALRKQFPGEASGFAGGAQLLLKLGRLEDAEAVATEMMRKFPSDIRGFLSRARILSQRKDWDAALAQWNIVAERFPTFGFGVQGIVQTYLDIGRLDEAEALIEQSRARYGQGSELWVMSAKVAQARGDRAEAIRRWKRRVEYFPLEWWGYRQTAAVFGEMGELAEAETMLRAAVERFEENVEQLRDLAAFLKKHGDAASQAAVWETMRERYPSLEEGYLRSAELMRLLGRMADAEATMAAHKARFATAA